MGRASRRREALQYAEAYVRAEAIRDNMQRDGLTTIVLEGEPGQYLLMARSAAYLRRWGFTAELRSGRLIVSL